MKRTNLFVSMLAGMFGACIPMLFGFRSTAITVSGGSVSGALTGITSITGSGGAVLDLSGASPSWDSKLTLAAGAEIAASQDLILGDDVRICDADDCDGFKIDSTVGRWNAVANGVENASYFLDVDNYRTEWSWIGGAVTFVFGNGDTTVAISGGTLAVSFNNEYVTVAAESATADDLDTISGTAYDGMMRLLRADAGDTITIKNGTGNISTASGADVTMTDSVLVLTAYDAGTSTWYTIGQ